MLLKRLFNIFIIIMGVLLLVFLVLLLAITTADCTGLTGVSCNPLALIIPGAIITLALIHTIGSSKQSH